jgi:serine/threonine-protein kinase
MERRAGPPLSAPAFDARRLPSSDSSAEGRFIPGTSLAGRYRIVGLLGRGGMGEVYRADDLKLGQPVALKFLPSGLEKDDARLSRLLNEVRTARQISHPSVCRVYDIGEVDGQHFLSMEYVDGEDLATLLLRIGRLPKDKAIQIARQMCAGLAAAHEQGILHRDLKPANVMIDGRGRVRITDFGLAGLVETLRGGDVCAGTPAYMAPEQVAGREVSVRSDLYSLGLVLYEVFTGEPVFKASTLVERGKLQRETSPTSPSSLVEGFDPAVERAILRCLEPDPRERPSSALAVAAALPGGDPLAAALAAGETPSPQMVADAGEMGGLRPAVAGACLTGILLGAALTILGSGGALMSRRVPLEKPPEALAERAREIARRLGYTEPATDSALGFDTDNDYLRYVELNDLSPSRWDGLATGQPAAVYFWFRQSPRYLEVKGFEGPGPVRLTDPPEDVSGMLHVLLDPKGRLIDFLAVPPQIDEPEGMRNEPDWSVLFKEAGLDVAKLTPTVSKWVPPVFADSRAAWEGSLPDRPEISIRVEAGSYRGRPVYFQSLGPWSRPARMQPFQKATLGKVAGIIAPVLGLSTLLGGLLVARRNLRLGRGDRRGAFRLALCMFFLFLLSWLSGASHVPRLQGELGLFFIALAFAVLASGILWLFYIALEPYVRRRWPGMIISWSRLIAGRLRDPLVGRDILIGGLCGIAIAVIDPLYHLLPAWLGLPPQAPHPIVPGMLLDVRHLIGGTLGALAFGISQVLFLCFVLVLLRILLRRQWLAATVFFLFGTFTLATGAGNPYVNLLYAAALSGIVTFTLIRFGLLAAVVAQFLSSLLLDFPLTFDFSAWYAVNSLFGLAIVAALAIYGFYVSLAGRSIFREELLEA